MHVFLISFKKEYLSKSVLLFYTVNKLFVRILFHVIQKYMEEEPL